MPLVHCLGNTLGHLTCLAQRNGWITYNLPHIVLNVVRSDVMGRSSGTDYNYFLPSIVLRANELGRVDDLSLEISLRSERGCEFRALTSSSLSTHFPFKVRGIGISRQPKGDNDVGGLKDSYSSVGSTATNSNIPLPLLILSHLLYESGSPNI